jgi:hypothetical protein
MAPYILLNKAVRGRVVGVDSGHKEAGGAPRGEAAAHHTGFPGAVRDGARQGAVVGRATRRAGVRRGGGLR